MNGKLFFVLLFLTASFVTATYYPAPYYANDNMWTLRNETWLNYQTLVPSANHDKILVPYSYGISSNTALNTTNGLYYNNSVWFVSDINQTEFPPFLVTEGENLTAVTRVGSWTTQTDTAYSNSSYVFSNTSGDYVSFNFTGSLFTVYYRRNTMNGIIEVYVNDTLFTQIDTYGVVARTQANVAFRQFDGYVNIKLKVASVKNPASTNYNVSIDNVITGSGNYLPYLQERLGKPDAYNDGNSSTYVILNGTTNASYLAASVYHYYEAPWIYNQTFYLRVKNPTANSIMLNISAGITTADYANGTANAVPTGVNYCVINVPPTGANWVMLVANISNTTGGAVCANATNNTWVGMRRTWNNPATLLTGFGVTYRISTNASNLWLDDFWVGLDAELPTIKVVDAVSGADLTNGGYMDCNRFRSTYGGVNISVYGLIPNSVTWRLRILGSFGTYDYAYNTSVALTANATGGLQLNNFIDAPATARSCGAYDYSNTFFVELANTGSYQTGTSGTSPTIATAPVILAPWDWNFPEVKITNLDTGVEEYVLRPNTHYRVSFNITNSTGDEITNIGATMSFVQMSATSDVLSYENPFLINGTVQTLIASDTQFYTNYSAALNLWQVNFTTPATWKYDGHVSALRFRVSNNSNATYTMRWISNSIPMQAMYVLFSNHVYSGTGVDVVSKDLDFGSVSGSHAGYTASGGTPPTYNDGIKDLYMEDARKIVLVYNNSGTVAQAPIVWYDKLNGYWAAAQGLTSNAPGYTYLASYRQDRTVYADTGLSRDYAAVLLNERNSLGYSYNTTLYFPANSDWIEAYHDFPDVYTLDLLWQELRLRSAPSTMYVPFQNEIATQSIYAKENYFNFHPVMAYPNVNQYDGLAFGNTTSRATYLGYYATIPYSQLNALRPCYPYCFDYRFSNASFGLDSPRWNDRDFQYYWRLVWATLVTEGLDEYRTDTQLWSMFTFSNVGSYVNYAFDLRKVKARFIMSDIFTANDDAGILQAYNQTWQYGYPLTYGHEGTDVYFDKYTRSYNVNQQVTVNLTARNYTVPASVALNAYVLNDAGNILYTAVINTNAAGQAGFTFTPTATGVYRVRITNAAGYNGIGFFWVRQPTQSITTNKGAYIPSETVSITDSVTDSSSGAALTTLQVNCTAYDAYSANVWNQTLSLSGSNYVASMPLSASAASGIWTLTCIAYEGTTPYTSSIYFSVANPTATEKAIADVRIDAPASVITNSNFSVDVFVKNSTNQLANCDNVTLTMTDSLSKLILLNAVNMSINNTGQYNYTTSVVNQSTFLLQANCTIGNLSYVSNPRSITSQAASLNFSTAYWFKLSDFESLVAGRTYYATVNAWDLTGAPANLTNNPNITIYDSLRNIIVSSAPFNYSSDGLYNYSYVTLSSAISGVWESKVTVNVSGRESTVSDFWRISGAPADVVINSVIIADAFDVTASVGITNMGTQDSDFYYVYCVVAQETNACGGGDDLYYATGTRFISAGTMWTSIMPPVNPVHLTSAGTYWFKVLAKSVEETNWAGASRMFITSTGLPGGGGVPTPTIIPSAIPPISSPLPFPMIYIKEGVPFEWFIALVLIVLILALVLAACRRKKCDCSKCRATGRHD